MISVLNLSITVDRIATNRMLAAVCGVWAVIGPKIFLLGNDVKKQKYRKYVTFWKVQQNEMVHN
jgi:hypothetical protein